jgi:uncharacterized membrane protein
MQAYEPKQAVPFGPPPTAKELFQTYSVKHVDYADIKKWLLLGWADIQKNPAASLAYGAILALTGIVFSMLFSWNAALVTAAATGFLLFGPFLAVGLYDLSRRIEHNEPPTFRHSMGAISHNMLGLGIYALALAVLFISWVMSTLLFMGVLFPSSSLTVTASGSLGIFSGLTALTTINQGWLFILGFFAIGLLFATAAFMTGVVTVPMLLHRKVDLITAGATSFLAVLRNPLVMAVWAGIIALVIGFGLLTYYIGLIIAMPLIAHASWHAYRDLVEQNEQSPG